MKLAMVGLGKMGANMVRRLVRDGHQVVAYDLDTTVTQRLASESDAITAADTLAALIEPALKSLAPAPDQGWGHVGPAGAGKVLNAMRAGFGGHRIKPAGESES